MLIKKITLENFRQFKDIQSVEFSEDNVKNITIILGENGAGKTTFAQAFRWCLYGKTTFTDSFLLNKEISQNLGPNKESFVRVSLQLIHNNIEYEITREQKYTTNATGGLNTPNSSELKIKYRNPQGITKFVEQREVDLRIKEILPSELSNYFFFDGERIQNMSKEINEGKSAEFKDAVERLLGLSAFTITLDHLNGRSSSSVIKSYNRDFDSKANSQIADLQDKIDSLNKELNKIDERNKEIDDDVSMLERQQEELSKEMEANKDSENIIKEKKGYEISSEKLKKEKSEAISNFVDIFNTKGLSWFSRKIIRDVLTELAETDSLDKGIPDITAKTIDYLKNRGVCICGTCLKEKELEAFNELLKFIPPKSLGNFISDFSGSAKQRLADSENFYEDSIVQKYREIRGKDSELEELNLEISEIEKRLKNIKSSADLQIKSEENNIKIANLNREKSSLLEEKGAKTEQQSRAQSSLDEQALKSASNKKIAVYKAYATYMYQLLKDDYLKREKEVRERLQENINEIFKNIYNGKLS